MNFPQLKTYTTESNKEKFKYIAEKNKRKVSKELEILVENHIKAYEAEHGPIPLPEQEPESTTTPPPGGGG